MIRRILVYSLLAVVVYYGYTTLNRAASTAPEMRGTAASKSEDSGPIGSAVERRRADERAVQEAAGRSPEKQQDE
jgi:hypothetical protein